MPKFGNCFEVGDWIYYPSHNTCGIVTSIFWGHIWIKCLDGEDYEVAASYGKLNLPIGSNFLKHITDEEFAVAEVLHA